MTWKSTERQMAMRKDLWPSDQIISYSSLEAYVLYLRAIAWLCAHWRKAADVLAAEDNAATYHRRLWHKAALYLRSWPEQAIR